MKKKHNPKLGPLGIIVAVLLLAGVAIYIAGKTDSNYIPFSNSTQEQTKTYQSRNMHFSIQINSSFQTRDDDSAVDLISSKGQINIVRNGTNFNDIDSYISEFDSRRKLISSNSEKISINGYEAISRLVKFKEENSEQKSYYIYSNYYVYIISTSSESLYADLDQIARSFRYTP